MTITGPWQRAANGANLLTDGVVQPTIFARMSGLAAQLGAMNLGQGFPDTQPPAAVARAAMDEIANGANQYPPGPGRPELREAIARHQERFYGSPVDPSSEILVTTGATEAIAATILAFVRPGDEVLTLEPYYDSYAAMIALAGGAHRTVRLDVHGGAEPAAAREDTTGEQLPEPDEHGASARTGAPLEAGTAARAGAQAAASAGTGTGPELTISADARAIVDAIGPRTRMILLNTPHNPTGILLDRATLQAVVDAARENDAIVVVDEVYEHLVFDGEHAATTSLDGWRDVAIGIGSAGKTFSTTGWKIGWTIASAEHTAAITAVKQWLTFATGSPFQRAIAAGLDMPDADYAAIRDDLRERRDRLVGILRSVGARVSVPAAGYFVIADLSPLGEEDGAALCERLPHEAGVVAIPVSAFCRHPLHEVDELHEGPEPVDPFAPLVRFAFCKDDATLDEAERRLRAWAERRG